ncbi:MAG: hypothetical protein FJ014_05190 [Chloroflexi bacterium]|nr:hypothetical protein [Chloroflexota bacterium]
MPTLPAALAKLSFLMTTPAIVGLVFTASLIVVIRDWRFSLAALSVQYVLVGLLLTQLIQPQVALIKVLIGALVCVVLYLTARLVDVSRGNGSPLPPPSSPPTLGGEADFAFRLLAALFVGLIAYSLSKRYPLPEMSPDIGLACYWLASLGLLTLMLTEEPLKAGMGLLTLIAGFELFYSVLERSLSVAGFLGIANFLVALAVAYLAAASSAEWTAEEKER